MAEAMRLMGTLQEMDELEQPIRQARQSGDIEGLDADQMRDLVGGDEAAALEEIQNLMKELEEKGLVKRDGDRYELTAQGIRRIGQKALEDIFAQVARATPSGSTACRSAAMAASAPTTRSRTSSAIPSTCTWSRRCATRSRATARARRSSSASDDFEVYRTEHQTRTATVVLLDMSYSMLSNDLWMPAKKVAIALESLIRGQFPRDVLHLVGFNYLAREYKPEEIVAISEWDNVQGTNMIHALMMARTLLARSRAANKQILMITDGGPTVRMDGGRWIFNWPPTTRRELQTLREVRRCMQEGIVVNVFMLSDEGYLKHFVNQMATVNKGRAFYVDPRTWASTSCSTTSATSRSA